MPVSIDKLYSNTPKIFACRLFENLARELEDYFLPERSCKFVRQRDVKPANDRIPVFGPLTSKAQVPSSVRSGDSDKYVIVVWRRCEDRAGAFDYAKQLTDAYFSSHEMRAVVLPPVIVPVIVANKTACHLNALKERGNLTKTRR